MAGGAWVAVATGVDEEVEVGWLQVDQVEEDWGWSHSPPQGALELEEAAAVETGWRTAATTVGVEAAADEAAADEAAALVED